jgi:hypothetical protein
LFLAKKPIHLAVGEKNGSTSLSVQEKGESVKGSSSRKCATAILREPSGSW